MKKLITLFLLCATSLFAQAPEKFSYQAVVRNASNALVTDALVGVRVNILQGSADGSAVYVETQTATTNANGLLTIEIGGGLVQQGSFADIDWANGPYFLKTETDPNGGSNYTVTSTQQLLSVPYTLYAKEAANGFSGDYNDLTNTPTIPAAANNATLTIQKNGSDIGTFTADASTSQTINVTVPTTTSELTNNSGFITIADLPAVPTNMSQLNNDAGYITAAQCGDVDICTLANQLAQLQQQMAQLQAKLDSLEGNTTFTCGTSTVTDHEGNVYNTVQFGSQCWTKENLRTTTSPSTGTYLIPASGTGNTYTGKQACWYNNDSATYAPMTYGLLYNWNAAVDTFNTAYGELSVNTSSSNAVSVTFGHRRGICPVGWHLPSDAEWTVLTDYVRSQSDYVCGNNTSYIAKALASTTGWYISTYNCAVGNDQGVNNASGFGAVPAGSCYGNGSWFYDAGYNAYFWSSTERSGAYAHIRYLSYDDAPVYRNDNHKIYGFSVRCIRDAFGGGGSSASLPTVTTGTVSEISATTVTCGGNVTADGGATVTARGVCWSTSQNPTVSGSHTTDGSGMGSFTSNITGLAAHTTYYMRAYATNSVGIAYGAVVSFNTIGGGPLHDGQPCPAAPTVTDHEGNVYNTVQIGNQCWTKENLRTTTSPSTGTYLIPVPSANCTYMGKQARWYNNDSTTYAPMNYGLLYNWNAAVDTFNTAYGETSVNTSYNNIVSVTFSGHRRGICPVGWHLPSDAEWTVLTEYVRNQSDYVCGNNTSYIAKALASTTGWNTSTYNCAVGNDQGVNNASGFGAVPAGYCVGSSFDRAGYTAYFWSSTEEESSDIAYDRTLHHGEAYVYSDGDGNKVGGFSVRCLRDDSGSGTASLPTVTTDIVSNIAATSATCGGEVTVTGGADVTARGVCWGTSQNPTVADAHTTDGSGMGSFTSSITGLTANTTYYVRAYATNSLGTAYGAEVSFTTIGGGTLQDGQPCPAAPTVTDHEGNVYATVQIGQQCWMRDNLRTTTSPSTGTYLIPTSSANYTSTGKQARWYENDSATYAPMNYGLLYNWNAAVDTFNTAYGETSVNTDYYSAVSVTFSGHRRGVCPVGWHLPSDAEWAALTNYMGSQSEFQCGGSSNNIAKALASTIGWNTSINNCAVGNDQGTNNASGFEAVPAGNWHGGFNNAGDWVSFWSSTNFDSVNAYCRGLGYYVANVYRNGGSKSGCLSVRCLRD